jgi:ribosomal protein L21E
MRISDMNNRVERLEQLAQEQSRLLHLQDEAIKALSEQISELKLQVLNFEAGTIISRNIQDDVAEVTDNELDTGITANETIMTKKAETNDVIVLFQTINQDGYCVGDKVRILCDRAGNIFSKRDRRTPTSFEGQTTFVTKVTKQSVWVQDKDETRMKRNYNVSLVAPAINREIVRLPNGSIKNRNNNRM